MIIGKLGTKKYSRRQPSMEYAAQRLMHSEGANSRRPLQTRKLDELVPPGMRVMPEEERLEMLGCSSKLAHCRQLALLLHENGRMLSLWN